MFIYFLLGNFPKLEFANFLLVVSSPLLGVLKSSYLFLDVSFASFKNLCILVYIKVAKKVDFKISVSSLYRFLFLNFLYLIIKAF